MAKKSKAETHYRATASAARNCHRCEHIQLHGDQMATCELVGGTVDRDHVCDLFESPNDREPDNDSDDQ